LLKYLKYCCYSFIKRSADEDRSFLYKSVPSVSLEIMVTTLKKITAQEFFNLLHEVGVVCNIVLVSIKAKLLFKNIF
jgi:hypothetical protein